MARIKRQRSASIKNLETARKQLRSSFDSTQNETQVIERNNQNTTGQYNKEVYNALSDFSKRNSGHSVNRSNSLFLSLCF